MATRFHKFLVLVILMFILTQCSDKNSDEYIQDGLGGKRDIFIND